MALKKILMAGAAAAVISAPGVASAQMSAEYENCVEYRDGLLERLGETELETTQRDEINTILRDAGRLNAAGDDQACMAKLDEVEPLMVAVVDTETDAAAVAQTEADAAVVAQADTQTQELGVAGGQIQVETPQPEVNVQVPEPEVTVTQPQPEVIVNQAEPEVIVRMKPPIVNVQIPEPVVTVEQVQPEVIVQIPEPQIAVRQANPQVDVATGQPMVDVESVQPKVSFVRPEPKIIVEEAEAEVNVATAEPQVSIAKADTAEVRVQRADAEVEVQQTGEAQVNVEDAEPRVEVQQAEGADIQVEQAEPQIAVEQAEPQVNVATSTAVERDVDMVVAELEASPLYQMQVVDLIDQDLYGAAGEEIGEIEDVVFYGNSIYLVTEVGGFLGLGERQVAIPLQDVVMQGDEFVVPGATEEMIEDYEEANYDQYQVFPREGLVGDTYQGFIRS